MPVVHKSIEVHFPNRAPYDTDYDLEAFAGEYILPIHRKLKRFWFTRYGSVGQRHTLFRFSTAQFEQLQAHFDNVVVEFGGPGCVDYNYVDDLGAPRFLGTDARNQSRVRRANFVYAFLTASAKLFLESIVKEADGHWRHESERQSHYNRETSLESFHHLFCNMTGVPIDAGLITAPTGAVVLLEGDLYARKIYAEQYAQQHPDHSYQLRRIHH